MVSEDVTGSCVVTIHGYSTHNALGNGNFRKTSTFSVAGHCWYLLYYPQGDNRPESADWISIYLQLVDTDAKNVVNARYRFSILDGNGKQPVQRFSREATTVCAFSSEHPCWGISRFVRRADLESSTCLKDGSFRVRCEVTVSSPDIGAATTARFVAVPPSNMHLQFGRLLSGAEGADVTFEVAGEVFAAHRCVLAARTSVFKAELFGPMKEKAMDCVQIQDMEAVVFWAMLHFIYTDTVPDIDKGDAFVITQHLLVAADRYDLERLKLICEDKLCNCIDTSTVVTTLALAERHGCHGLKKACFEFLKSAGHLKTVMATEGFDHLMTTCPSLIKELMLAKVATLP